MFRRFSLAIMFTLPLAAACARNQTPAARSCSVLNTASQLDACAGKSVTIRGVVAQESKPMIIGVEVDAGAELVGKTAHAFGTLERAGAVWALRANGTLAKAHGTN